MIVYISRNNSYSTPLERSLILCPNTMVRSVLACIIIMVMLVFFSGKKGGETESISWSNPVECERYIHLLQEAAERLSRENRSEL